jgi:hypothetical protein
MPPMSARLAFQSASALIVEFLLVPPCARVPTPRTASYDPAAPRFERASDLGRDLRLCLSAFRGYTVGLVMQVNEA